MRSTNSPTPTGNEKQTTFVRGVLRKIRDEFNFFDSTTVRVEQTTRGIRFHAISISRSSASCRGQYPKELNPAIGVAKDVFVYISSGNPLVTAGAVDVVSQVLTTAQPGFWQAAAAVPAQTTVNGVVQYNVPVFPYPSATGEVSEAPSGLQGDLDSSSIFWIYWGQVAC